jgi:hypothetical protein
VNAFSFSLSMPPSSNNMFATYNGRRIISREYKTWRAAAEAAIAEAWTKQGSPRFDRHMQLSVAIGLNYCGDISNRIKAIEDAIGRSIEGFPDDRYYDRVEIERVPGLDGARVLVTQLAPPERRAA